VDFKVLPDTEHGIEYLEQVVERHYPGIPWLAECHLRGDVVLHTHLNVFRDRGDFLDTHPHYYCSLFYPPHCSTGAFGLDPEIARGIKVEAPYLAAMHSGNMKLSMLVGVGHPEQVHQGIVLPSVSGWVSERLVVLDDIQNDIGDTFRHCGSVGGTPPLFDGLHPLRLGFANRERCVRTWIALVSGNEAVDKVVETSPQIVNEITELESPPSRWREHAAPLDDCPAILLHDFSWAGMEVVINEDFPFYCQGIEVRTSSLILEEVARRPVPETLREFKPRHDLALEEDGRRTAGRTDTIHPQGPRNPDPDQGAGLP